MKIRNLESAIVPHSKIVNYLLNPIHHTGKNKAKYFLRHVFTIENWQTFAKALVHHAEENEVVKQETSLFGTRLIVEGKMKAPDNVNFLIRLGEFALFGRYRFRGSR